MATFHLRLSTVLMRTIFVCITLILCTGSRIAVAQTETILYSFCAQDVCADGAWPDGDLIMDASGNLYGTADAGVFQSGVVFELTPFGTETVILAFNNPDYGLLPSGGLVRDASGNFYGEALEGGYFKKHICKQDGCGLVYQLTPSWSETVIYNFTGSTAGGFPSGGLALDADGNFYGATFGLGPKGHTSGSVFKVTPSGVETLLHKFGASKSDGFINVPQRLVVDQGGNIYGTTDFGGVKGRLGKNGNCGRGCGTIFEINASGVETILHTFKGYTQGDGAHPMAGLILDGKGNLYGTTNYGGLYGYGTIFQLTPTGEETILYPLLEGRMGPFRRVI